MTRPRYTRVPIKCVCQNNADAPSTHRGAEHTDPRCPHSTLAETTGGYQRLAEASQHKRAAAVARRKAAEQARARRVVTPIILLE